MKGSTGLKYSITRLTSYLLLLLSMIAACDRPLGEGTKHSSYPAPGHDLTPEQLAKAFCGSCHLYPDPSLLERSTWEGKVLKDMGRRLGVRSEGYDPFHNLSMYDDFVLKQSNIYPDDTLISDADWNTIVNYYLDQAPDSIPKPIREEIGRELPHFEIRIFDSLPYQPLTTLTRFHTHDALISWGSRQGDLLTVDTSGNVLQHMTLESPPSCLWLASEGTYVLTMGIMDPSEESQGKLQLIGRHDEARDLITGLQRPVHFSAADLDNDASLDFIISQFGNQTGKLTWHGKAENGMYREHLISPLPGYLSTEIHDFDKDGLPDIMALRGQGDEAISIFYNRGAGRFEEKVVLRFPPVYGSSSFQLVDFNHDSEPDILYTNGDNADFTYSLKHFHGVRIFMNQGDGTFSEEYFYPMYGAMKALAHDFDLDGDLDIFALSFFPDFHHEKPEGFVYLENRGNLQFQSFSFPQSVNGRWLVADATDFDMDGDIDIIIGSLLFPIKEAPDELRQRWASNNYYMALLKNTVR